MICPVCLGRRAFETPTGPQPCGECGGMGTVHLGSIQAGRFERTGAIKRIRAANGDGDRDREALVASLLREASIGAQPRHVNVVSVIDLIVEEASGGMHEG